MSENVQKEFRLGDEDVAELLRDIADALENEDQLNIDLGDSKLVQPLGGIVPLRVYQDDSSTEIGFQLHDEE